jgi:hypothetical protein
MSYSGPEGRQSIPHKVAGSHGALGTKAGGDMIIHAQPQVWKGPHIPCEALQDY